MSFPRARNFFVILPFLLFSLSLRGESPAAWLPEAIRYTSRNGLPTAMVFKVMEDRQGYLWLATNNGAVRYDGHTFRTYTTRDGLANNTILNMAEDAAGRIWFISLSRSLCYFENGRIRPFPANGRLEKMLEFPPADIFFGEEGTIRIVPVPKSILIEVRGENITEADWRADPRMNGADYLCRLEGDRWMTLYARREQRTGENRIVRSGKGWYALTMADSGPENYYNFRRLRNGTLIAASPSRLVAFDSTGRGITVYSSPKRYINGTAEDAGGDLWVLTRDGALRYRQGKVAGRTPEHYLPGTFITNVMRDRAGNYWFSSWDNGLIRIPGMEFRTLRPSASAADNAFSSIKVYDDKVWCLTTRGDLYVPDEKGAAVPFLNGKEVLAPTSESADFMRDSAGRIWIGQQLRIALPLPGGGFRLKSLPCGAVKKLLPLQDGSTATATANGFGIVRNDSLILSSGPRYSFTERTNGLYQDDDGSLWLGTISGLYRYDGEKIFNYGDLHPLLRNRIVAIRQRRNGDLLLGTQGAGMLVMRDDGGTIRRIDAESGLAGDIVRSLYVENDSVIWVGTNRGLSRVVVTDEQSLRCDIVTYTTAKGLPSDGINDIALHRGLLWLATDDGICRFDPNFAGRNMLPLPIEITEVAIDGKRIDLNGSYRLAHDRNNLTISFVGIGFRTAGDIRYRYRLLGLGKDTAWHETVNRAIPFFSLPPGDYRFQVSAMNEDGIWNPRAKEVTFRIVPHFTQTLGFRIGTVCLALLGIGLGAWRILERRRRTYAIEAQISELRQQGLSAAMNPHFIANALSVVQDYVLHHNPYEANEFLARFSRLIRLNLETSLRSFVTLEQELERLELYLAFEKLRFGEDLEFRIVVGDGIDPDETLVPSMLVQPYVENAILHGVIPAGRPGVVTVEAAPLGPDVYTIVIRDNGIGYSETTKKEERKGEDAGRESLSMRLNRERLALLSKSLKRPFSITVTVSADEAGNPTGTVVTILLPRNPTADRSR